MRTQVAVVVAALALAACGHEAKREKPLPPDRATELLHQRLWLDHVPRGPSDKFSLVVFDDGGTGITQRRSVWKGDFELFFHDAEHGEITYFLPASGTEMHTAFRIEPLRGNEHADLKLVIDHPPTGPREYIGMPFEGHADVASLDAFLATRFPRK